MIDKTALRARLRSRRDAHARDVALPVAPAYAAALRAGLCVASYVPLGSEADPAPYAAQALAAGCIIALPHVTTRSAPIQFLEWDGRAPLVAGPFNLRQPEAHAAERRPDIILTPLVGFDRHGHRLGQGAGHYDRAFATLPQAWRIGIAWSVQEVDALPVDPWDMPLHAIATESDWIVP